MNYADFDSRLEFVKALNLYHYDLNGSVTEFVTIKNSCSGFESEVDQIKSNFDIIRQTWNDQSINQIEKSVSKQGKSQLDIMLGQKNDKVRAGYQADAPQYRISKCNEESIFNKLGEHIGLEQSYARYHVQFPGEVTAFHTDIFSPAHEFLPALPGHHTEIGKDTGIRRVLIALQDWNWGQVLMFGTGCWTQWKAGDMIYWDYGIPHCASNMGYEPRISVSITGLATDKFYNFISK